MATTQLIYGSLSANTLGAVLLSATTVSATTYLNLPNNVVGNYLPLSGGTVSGGTSYTNGLTANTISATTLIINGITVTGDTYVTGLTFNTSNYNLTIGRNDGVSFTDSLSILASDLTVTGGSYNPNTGIATFTNNTGGTFNVTGFLTGLTDTFVTGGTYSNGTATFTNTSGGTFNVSGFTQSFSGGTVSGTTIFTNGLTANTISATTYQNLPISGTHNYLSKFSSGSTILVDSQLRDDGSTVGLGIAPNVNAKLFVLTSSQSYGVAGANQGTNGIGVYGQSNGLGNILGVFGLANGSGTSNIGVYGQANNATTNIGLKGYAFGGTNNYSIQLLDGTEGIGKVLTSVTSDGKANWQTLPSSTFTGGTVTGPTTFTNGVSANTLTVNGVNITGDTYVTGLTFNTSNYNLTIGRNDGASFTDSLAILASDLTVTGGTYNPNNGTATFTNNTGGTFTVTGFLTGLTDIYVTGGTYSNGTATFTNTSGGTFDVSGFTQSFTGGSGNCITDFYVTNIHSCSPLNINPLDEGNVYFGSTSGITVDVTNSRLGIGTNNPQTPLQVNGINSIFSYDPTSSGGRIQVSGTTGLPRIVMTIPTYLTNLTTGVSVGIRSWDDLIFSGYGKTGDSFLYAGQSSNGLNIINDQGTSSEDYIRFYAGLDASSGNTPDIHIQGSGSTRGNVGIGTANPTERLDVSGKTKTINLQITSGATNGYVLTSDASGNASWQASSSLINPFINSGSGATITWNVSGVSTNYEATLTATTTLNLTNVRNGDYGTIIINQDGVGGRTLTLGSINGSSGTHKVANGGGGLVVLTSNANAIDILTFTYNGSIMYWTVGNDYT